MDVDFNCSKRRDRIEAGVGVRREHGGAHRGAERRRIAGCPGRERHESERQQLAQPFGRSPSVLDCEQLTIVHEYIRRGLPIDGAMTDIVDDADDLDRHRPRPFALTVPDEGCANRILAEMLSRELTIH